MSKTESNQTADAQTTDYPQFNVDEMRRVLPDTPSGGVRLLNGQCNRCGCFREVRPDTLCPPCAAALGRPAIPRGPEDHE